VSPAEVEARLLAHQAVAQAVVVAALDREGLEKPVAYVILEAGQAATEDELIEFCRQALPSFKRPRKVVFVGGYPTTATGKIRRVELRRMAATVLLSGTPVPGKTVLGETAPGNVLGETVLAATELGETVLPGESG
jgi:acyl-coenzyme A synthetase/AMP-(fatty) acid ligase